jgi:hypothetical protein
MKIPVMEAAAHSDNIASNRILKNWTRNDWNLFEDGVWNWYELKNQFIMKTIKIAGVPEHFNLLGI